MFYRIDGIADGNFGDLDAARFIDLAELTPRYRGAMREVAEAQAEAEADGEANKQNLVEPDDERDDIELDETEQALTDLPMEAI